jgi:hypothetical protein
MLGGRRGFCRELFRLRERCGFEMGFLDCGVVRWNVEGELNQEAHRGSKHFAYPSKSGMLFYDSSESLDSKTIGASFFETMEDQIEREVNLDEPEFNLR